MAIRIARKGKLHTAEVTPPHGGGTHWTSPEPLTVDALIDALHRRGCHQTDIGDAFNEADPEWQLRE